MLNFKTKFTKNSGSRKAYRVGKPFIFIIMKLESLKLEKFQDSALKKEQMFMLNGGGTKTGANWCYTGGTHNGRAASFYYGYDSDRGGVTTYHDRSQIRYEEIEVIMPGAIENDESFIKLLNP